MDDFGHGTHVAGIIAAAINNGVGIAGLAKTRIMAEKVLDATGSGSSSEIAEGIVHAVDMGAKIINLSLGSPFKSELLHEAVLYAYDHGVLVVAAAGNDATSSESYPAAYDQVVAVSATDESDKPAVFTNYGDWVDVAAPGVNIYSTMPTYYVTLNGEGFNLDYDYMSGTSMACPCAVGVAALIWSQFPNMTRDQVWAQLQCTADDLGQPGFDVYYGYGRIDAKKAVEWAPSPHDVLVLNLKTPSYVSLGRTTVINTTILNMGNSNESDVTVNLLVNDTLINSTVIDFLASGVLATASFSWNATVEGEYNITSFVVPVMGEAFAANNAVSKLIEVRAPQTIIVPTDYKTIQGAINAAHEGDTVFVASGEYHENVWINTEGLTLAGENRSTTVIDGGDISDVVLVSADNVRIDGFTLQNGLGAGIMLLGSSGTTIGSTMIWNNTLGVYMESSPHATLHNNNMTGNEYNFGVDGDSVTDFLQDIDTSNTVNGKPVYYWVGEHDKQVPSDAGYVAIVNSTDIILKDLNLTENYEDILFAYTNNSFIENVNASNSYEGAYLAYSHNNTVQSNALMNNSYGIYLYESESNSIDFNELLSNHFYGIYLEYSGNNTLGNNSLANNGDGIYLEYSGNNTLRNNDMTNNNHNFGVYGVCLSDYVNDVDASNTVNGKPIYYWVGEHDKQVPSDAGYVAVVNSTSIIAENLDLSNNEQGILFAYTINSRIVNVTASDNSSNGIYLWGSDGNIISRNYAARNYEDGISLTCSDNNTIDYNTATDNSYGIDAAASRENDINGNVVLRNIIGIYLDSSDNSMVVMNEIAGGGDLGSLVGIGLTTATGNVISENTVSNNQFLVGAGIYLEWSSDSNSIIENTINNNTYGLSIGWWGAWGLDDQDNNNTIYHNDLIGNTNQVLNPSSINTWDDGYPSGGNYWSNYNGTDLHSGPYQNETGSDGIGDTPYVLDAHNLDNYPLMSPRMHTVGDLNGDGKVGLDDLVLLVQAYGSKPGDPNWNPMADLAPPYGIISLTDVVTLAMHYGQAINNVLA